MLDNEVYVGHDSLFMPVNKTLLRCCFCGLDTDLSDYAELQLRINQSTARQYLGAHRQCFVDRLSRGFNFELDPDGATS